MVDDDGYDGIRSHGVDPDWNPFSTPRDDDPDDIGWDDGSETSHANPSRMSGKGVAVLTACTLVIAVAGIGMVITESRLSVRHDQLVSECSDAVAIRRAPSIQCDATLRNRQLESNTAKARKQASAYVEQSKRVAAFRKEYDKTRSEKSRRDDMTRLSSDLRAARDLLDRTAGMELSVPYLRSRLADTVEQAEPFDGADDADHRRVSALADTVEDLMNQVRENAGL